MLCRDHRAGVRRRGEGGMERWRDRGTERRSGAHQNPERQRAGISRSPKRFTSLWRASAGPE